MTDHHGRGMDGRFRNIYCIFFVFFFLGGSMGRWFWRFVDELIYLSTRICKSCWSVALWNYFLFSQAIITMCVLRVCLSCQQPLWLPMLLDPWLLVHGFPGTVEVSRLEPRQNNYDLHHGCRVAQFVFHGRGAGAAWLFVGMSFKEFLRYQISKRYRKIFVKIWLDLMCFEISSPLALWGCWMLLKIAEHLVQSVPLQFPLNKDYSCMWV